MGGDGPTTFDRVLEFADGWMPIGGRPTSGASLGEKIATLKERWAQAGKDPETLPVTIFGARPLADLIRRLEQDGVTRVLFTVPPETAAAVLPILDGLAKLVRQSSP
jgi:hypothetical protein